jgi:acyl-CoA synthetase (AMP-forming)/AMP-acid ligase II
MLIFTAINVYPSELEQILMTHSDVENAAVIGVKHVTYNEVPLAFVTLVKGSTVSEQTLIDYVDSRVNYYKKLRGGLKILEAFPVTSLRKINKTELRKMVTNK